MFERHKNGTIGELKVTMDLLEKGFMVLNPVSENSPFDVVAYDSDDNKYWRVQVKSSSVKDRKLEVQYRRKSVGGEGWSRSRNDEFDVAAVYDRDNDNCYYVDTSDFNQALALRLESEVDRSNIRWADEHTGFPP